MMPAHDTGSANPPPPSTPRHGWAQPVVIAALALILSLIVFSPSFTKIRDQHPESFQWARGNSFLLQCQEPFRSDIEPALRWRVLPAWVAHHAGLQGRLALALPVAGVLALAVYVAALSGRRLSSPRAIAATTILIVSSSAVLVPMHWLGINDAWAWLGLLCVTFGNSAVARGAALLLAPWVDERFLIALPLALLVRDLDRPGRWRQEAALLLLLLPYVGIRIGSGMATSSGSADINFLRVHLGDAPMLLAAAPLGWWMAWRLGWIPVANVVRLAPLRIGLPLLATLLLGTVLAWDLSRTAAMLLPVTILGCWKLARGSPQGETHLTWIALGNLLVPAAHVVGPWIEPIRPAVVELVRLLR